MKRLALAIAILGALAIGVGVLRVVDLASHTEFVGRCVAGAIDLNRPDPYAKLELDGTIVGLAASGGGSRAAYLTAAVLREIRRSEVRLFAEDAPSSGRSLLDQIDAVSAVSGGSLAAGYFVANAQELKTADASDPAWGEFLDKMALGYRQAQYRKALGSPTLWAKFLLSGYGYGQLVRDDYDEVLFRGAKLAMLPDRPALYISSFDVNNGVRFIFSKHYIDTPINAPARVFRRLDVGSSELANANDLTYVRIDPGSVRLADAVYASSAYPGAYPMLEVAHCGSKLGFVGRKIRLADGALIDNFGLTTLLAQVRATLARPIKRSAVVAIAVDASYPIRAGESWWERTLLGQAVASVGSAIERLTYLSWEELGSTGVETDQLSQNWESVLTARPIVSSGGRCRRDWQAHFASGKLLLKPLIIRLGLRDIVNPDLLTHVVNVRDAFPAEVRAHLPSGTLADLSKSLKQSLERIPTDFALSQEARKTLDLVAYLLVHVKLAGDVQIWNAIAREASVGVNPGVTCSS